MSESQQLVGVLQDPDRDDRTRSVSVRIADNAIGIYVAGYGNISAPPDGVAIAGVEIPKGGDGHPKVFAFPRIEYPYSLQIPLRGAAEIHRGNARIGAPTPSVCPHCNSKHVEATAREWNLGDQERVLLNGYRCVGGCGRRFWV